MAQSDKTSYRIIPARSGHPTLVVSLNGRDYPLHSSVDPMKEAESIAGKLNPDRYDTLIVLGTGLGYHLLPLESMMRSYASVILIDVLDGLREVLDTGAAKFLVRDPKIRLLAGLTPQEIAGRLSELLDLSSTRGISVLEHPASLRLFPGYYPAVKKEIESVINRKAGNEATIKAFGLKYFRNILANCAMIGRFSPVSDLFGRFSGHNAIVVTSGPSLDSCIEVIRSNEKSCFVIAVDSALPVLDRHGISPDFTVVIDPQPYIYEHLSGVSPDHTIPVISISASRWAFRWAAGGIRGSDAGGFISLNSHPLSQIIASLGWDMGSIESGTGNVAGDAVNMALHMGFGNIALAGFDFSFPRYAIYARGTAYQRRYGVYFQNRFTTVEGRNAAYIFTSSGRTRKDGLYTRRSFVQYRDSLEALIGKQQAQVVSLCREGLAVRGAGDDDLFTGTPVIGDKREIMRSLAAGKTGRTDAFEVSTLRRALENKDVFRELAAASTGNASSEKKIERMISALLSKGAKKHREGIQ